MITKTPSFKILFIFVFFILFLFSPLNFAFGEEINHLIITEVQITGESAYNDFIEIYNPTDSEIDISGYKLKKRNSKGNESSIRVFPEGSKIGPKSYFLWANSKEGYADSIKADLQSTATLAKDNSIALFDPEDTIIDALAWGDSQNPFVEGSPFPQNPGKNQSLERKCLEGTYQDKNNNANDFKINENPSPTGSSHSGGASLSLSADAGSDVISLVGKEITFDGSGSTGEIKEYVWNFGDGTTAKGKIVTHSYNFPGEYYVSLKVSNDETESTDLIKVTIFSSSIFISEFLPNPEGEDSGKEWIEIVNTSERIEDISHWGISTDREKIGFVFPEGSYISPKGFLLLLSSVTNISLPNNGGSVFLFYPSGDIAQEIKYEKPEEGYSIARKEKDYFYTSTLTPAMANIISGETKEKEQSASVSSQTQSQKSSEKITKEKKEVKKPTSPRKFLTKNLLAEAKANKELLTLSALGVSIFSGFLGLGLVKLRRRIKGRANKEKETMEIEIEK